MSTLTRKHFQCIADHLRERQPTNPGAKLGYHLAITAVASALEEINPRFDRQRFVIACTSQAERELRLGPEAQAQLEELT